MTPCARGCCWTAYQVCARQRACPCHWDERRPRTRNNGGTQYRDPTSEQAIRNVEKERRGK